MSNSRGRILTRRDFLKLTGTGLAAAGFGSVVQACAPAATPAPAGGPTPGGASPIPSGVTLNMWWWGEQEAPGLEGWLRQSIDLYKQQSGNSVEATLQDTSVVISEFQTASAANNAPDVQFLWNGIYHMESVWLGYLEPLNGLIEDDLLKNSNATVLSVYQGQQYRLGWYAVPLLWLYNKEMFDQAGLDADAPPRTWDELLNACESLKASGVTPIAAGLKDGFWGEWYMGHGLGQNLDSPADAINLFIGDLDWREPRYHEHWSRLEELWKAGYINDDMNSIDLYPGIDLYGTGRGAMTAVVGPLVPAQGEALGAEKVGVMVFPVFGTGRMAGRPIADTQGLGIASQSGQKGAAADFLKFLHTEERVSALWDQVRQLPTDSTWDGSVIDDPVVRQVWSDWMQGDNVPYISNLMPTLFWTDAMFVNSQKGISGEFTGEQAGQNAYDVTQKWREQNPDLVEKYTTWANDLTL